MLWVLESTRKAGLVFMVRFLRKWLVPLLAGLLLIGIAIAFVPFSRQMEKRAQSELTLLMDRAFARIQASEQQADPMIAAEEESLLSKAKAVSRFLTHDDSLLASDALRALCEQLSIDRIDVANAEGTLIASSDAASVGTALGAQEAFAWTMKVADDASAELTQQDETEQSTLYACVGRSDIEGFVLLTRNDIYVKSALSLSGAEELISDMPYGGDVLFLATESGADGFFYESGNLCLRRTEGSVTLIAARPTTEVYAVRSAAILSFGAAIACIMICGVAWYLLRLEPVAEEEAEDEPAQQEAIPEETTRAQDEYFDEEQPRKRRKLLRPREREQEPQEPDLPEPEPQEEHAHLPEPRKTGRSRKRGHEEKDEMLDSEEGFEKIVE